ncbi:MAG: hypothetical protein KF886_01555 [Candidatus Hydrogenedentes bacterium]|nr:hypothetical protein [Candidatus Hydrogenedentota bacterium]
MNSNAAEVQLLLRIEGTESKRSTVDAPTLVATMDALQRAIYYVAMDCSGRDVRERARVPNDIARRFALDCTIAQPGSFAQPMTLGAFAMDTEDSTLIPKVVSVLNECIRAMSEQNIQHLRGVLSHEALRTRMLKTLSELVPKADSNHKLHLTVGDNPEFSITHITSTVFTNLKKQVEHEESYLTVTGRLHSIDFSENKIRIHYPGNQKELECIYDPSVEDLLLDNPRDWIQVSGTVVMDDDGEPKKIIGVDNICELDVSEIVIREIVADGQPLYFRPALRFSPQSTESRQLMYVVDETLGIDVYATTREELVELICAELELLWREQKAEDDERLSDFAMRRRKALRDAVNCKSA